MRDPSTDVLLELDAFYLRHRCCGALSGGVDRVEHRDVAWFGCAGCWSWIQRDLAPARAE